MAKHRAPWVRGLAATALIALGGCQTTGINIPKPVTVSSQDQAATVLVTSTIAGPWDEVAPTLNPKFTMSGDAAVVAVMPVTEHVQQESLDALGVSASVGLPTSSTQSSNGLTQSTSNGVSSNNGVTTTTTATNNGTASTSTTTGAPGVAPVVPTGVPLGTALPAAIMSSADLGVDPMLKYQAANYLNQEVQLFNQEINHVADRDCYAPFVAHIHLTVVTYQPHLAYSVHTRVGFFRHPGEGPATPENMAVLQQSVAAATDAINAARSRGDKAGLDQALAYLQTAKAAASGMVPNSACPDKGQTPIVVPFLAANDIQMALKSNAAEAAQQIALALSYMVQGVGGSAALNHVSQALTAISNEDMNSSLTVAAETDNTLYVQIQPNNQASGDPSLIGRPYDVWVLILVPRNYFGPAAAPQPADLDVSSYTQFRNAFDSRVLPRRPVQVFAEEADRVLPPYMSGDQRKLWSSLDAPGKEAALGCLWDRLSQGDFVGFQAALAGHFTNPTCTTPRGYSALLLDPDFAETLWVSLGSLIADNSYKTTHLQAPAPKAVVIPDQTVLLADDGTHPIQAVLYNVGGQSSAKLGAHLQLTPVDEKPGKPVNGKPGPVVKTPEPPISIAAQSVALDSSAHTLTLTFPSLTKIGVTEVADDTALNRLIVQIVDCDPDRQLCPALAPAGKTPSDISLAAYFRANKTTPQTKLTLASAGPVIRIEDGDVGVLSVMLSGLPAGETAALTVSGASVASVTEIVTGGINKLLPFNKNGHFVLSDNGAYTINLLNLYAGGTAAVSAQAMMADGKTKDSDPATASYAELGPSFVTKP